MFEVVSSCKGHPILPGDAVNGVGVNDFPGDHINPCLFQASLEFSHPIKELLITKCIMLSEICFPHRQRKFWIKCSLLVCHCLGKLGN